MIELIQNKLAAYKATNQLQEEHATKEILQEIALYGLWRAGFFKVAAFQGGTSLRILYGMTRFSEDLEIATVDWKDAVRDVERFVGSLEQQSLQLWSDKFFFHKAEKLNEDTKCS